MATITSNNGKLSLTKKKEEKKSGIVSNNGRLSISKKQEPKKVEDAFFASSTPVLPGPSYSQPLVAPRVSNPKVKNQGNLLSMDVAAQKDKREDVDDQIAALEAEKRTWENEKAIWENSEFRGQKWDEAEKQIRDIQQRIDTLQKSTFSQDVIDEAQSWQQGVQAYRQQKEEEEMLLRTTATQNTEEISALEEQAKVYELQIQQLQRSGVMKGELYEEAQKNYQDTMKQIDELRMGLSQQQIDRAAQLQEMAKLEGVTNYVGFENMSKYHSTRNGQTQYSLSTGYAGESGWDDMRYDVINRNEEAVAQAQANASTSGEGLDAEVYALKQMTDEEIAIYNYWYVEDKQKADRYIEMLMPELTKRQMNESLERYAQYAQESPVAASAFSTLISPARGLSYVGQAADFLQDGKIDENAGYNIFARAGTQIRETVGEDIEKALGEKWGKVGSFTYELGMSMGDFLMAAALSGGVGADTKAAETVAKAIATTIMGTGAAAQSVVEAKQRGLNDRQAFTLGTIAGIAEAATEKYSIEELLNKAALGKGALTYMLRNAVAEGSEEAASGIINTVADVLISRDKSQWQEAVDAYKAMDYAEDHAWRMALTDQAMAIGLDAIGGAISGGIMGAGGAAANEIGYNLSRPSGQRVSEQQIMDLIGRIAEEETAPTAQQVQQTEVPQQSNMAELERSGVEAGAQKKDIETARRISSATGRKIVFYRADPSQNGYYAGGVIYVNTRAGDPLAQIISHEMTHSVELSGVYQRLSEIVLSRIQSTGGSLENLRQDKIDLYRRNGVELTDQRAVDAEIVAEYVAKNLLTDEMQILQMVQNDRSLAEKIRDWINSLLAKLGNEDAAERAFLTQARDLYSKALQQTQPVTQQQTKKDARIEQSRQADRVEDAIEQAQAASKREEILKELEELRLQLLSGVITEEEFDGIYETAMQEPEMQDGQFSISDTAARSDMIGNLRKYLDGDMSLQELNRKIGARGATRGQAREDSVLSEDAQKIKNAARRQRVSVEEYLHRNWEMFDVDGQWNEAAREALDDERGARYSFAGERARTASEDDLNRAKQMLQEGSSREEILLQTGWFQGADGKWRFEINDSDMRYISRTEEGAVPGQTLADYLEHDELFRNYPQLRSAELQFGQLEAGVKGQYDPDANTITLSEELREAPEGTLIHEIQHAIQRIEGFATGANEEYWQRRLDRGYDGKTRMQKRELQRLWQEYNAIRENEPEFFDAMTALDEIYPDMPRGQVNWDTLEKIEEDPIEWQRFDAARDKIEEEFGDLKVWDFMDLQHKIRQLEMNQGRSAAELYYNTAGEIEARDAARRRTMSEEERRQTMPDVGNEDTVFVRDKGVSWLAKEDAESTSIKEQIEAHADELNQMAVVASAKVPTNLTKKDDAAKWAAPFLSKWGGRVDKQGYGEIFFSNKDVDKGLRYADTPAEKAAIVVMPQVLKRGIEVGRHNEHKGRAKKTITFAAPVELNGVRGNMAVVVNQNGNHYYAHRIVLPDGSAFQFSEENENAAQELSRGVTVSGSLADTTSAASGFSIDETEADVNRQMQRPQYSIQETEPVERENLPSKARAYLQSAERAMERGIGRALSVPTMVQRTDLREIVQSITDEYLKTGSVQDETVRSLFETAYRNGKIVDDEFYRDNKEVKDYLRTQAITLSEYDQHDIPDWNDWRKSAFGLLRISNNGLPVDVAYQEVQQMAPGLFPETITAPSDQIQRMREVSASIRRVEKNLDEYYGQEAEEFKRWALNDFASAINEHLSELQQVKRYADERAARQAEITMPQTVEEIMQLYTEMKDLRRNRDKVRAKNLLTQEDEMLLGKLHRGEITLEDLPEGSNAKGISKVFEAEREFEQKAKIIREYNNRRKQALRQEADEYLQTANDWKDKKTGLQYARETQERNIRDIVPDEALAQRIIDRYFTPVHEAQAQATKLKNETREMVKKMNLSRKVAKGNLVSEAHAVQLLGEAEDNIRVLENSKGRMKARDGKTLAEWRDVVTRLWTENPGLNEQKVRAAVDEFRKIYDRLFQQMNETRVRNGYEPINYRQGYFPHFQPGDTDGILGAFSKALGIDMQTAALPTSINGLTHTFKPGIQWFGNAQERLGFNTAYDAVEGFDKYIEGVADVIYQTDNLQRLRALAAQIRYRTTDEGIRSQVDQVMEDANLSEEDKKNRIEKIYESGKFTLSNFVVDLEEYTNLLANKKSRADRNMEQALGRGTYQLMKALESRVAANMVAVNPGSWITNLIPLTQGGAQLGKGNLLKGMWQTLKNYKAHDGFEGRSSFLTNRRGSDPLVRTWAQSASDLASRPMEYIDTFVSDSLVRARTMQNIQGGMSEEAAIREADAWAAGVMADRSKGSMPTLFNRSNPITKVFTQFQLEVNNQFSYLFKDLPREQRKKGILALTTALLKFFLGAWLYNEIYEYFIGRRPALDPIGMLNTAVGDFTGYQLPNLVELGQDLIGGEDPDFTTEKQNRYTAVYNLFVASAEELPFIGGVLGGGRVPIQSALPDFQNLGKVIFNEDWSPEKKLATAGKELMAPATYLLPPFGGGQVKKLLQGIKATIEGGRYTVDAQGNKKLQYPVYKQEAVTAAIFGPTATSTGREWIENDFPTLGIHETAAYDALRETGMSEQQAYELVQDVRAAEKTGELSEAKVERQVLRNAEATDEEKGIVYYSMLASDKEIALMDLLAETNEDLGTVYQMLDTVKDAENSNVKRQAILDANLTEDEKIAAYRYLMGTKQEDGSYLSSRDDDIEAFRAAGMSFDDFLMAQNRYTEINETVTGAGNKATDFSWWADHQNWTNAQKQVAKEAFSYYSNVPASAGNYDKLTGAGLDQQTAYDLADAFKALEPMEGKSQVSDVQKYKAIADAHLSDEDTLAAFGTIMGEKEMQKVQAGYDMAVSPRVYANVKYTLSQFDADGSGSYNQQEIEEAIDAYASSNPLMRLNNGDKAILWQMLTGSTSAKNNPYSRNVAQDYLDRMQEE